jgi:hypothetical protein
MNDERQSGTDDVLEHRCARCQRMKPPMSGALCSNCISELLISYLPRLMRVLEGRYGSELDQWLAEGHFDGLRWILRPNFQVNSENLDRFLHSILREALAQQTLWLDIPHYCQLIPSETKQLMNFVSEQCGPALQRLLTNALAQAIQDAPTEQAGREVLDIATGQRPARNSLERAIMMSAVTETSANPLPFLARVLLELRYREVLEVDPYTTITSEGLLHPAWLEIREFLPVELSRLLPEDDNGWE